MPNFQTIWNNHPNIKGDTPLLDQKVYANQCTINLSAALVRSGWPGGLVAWWPTVCIRETKASQAADINSSRAFLLLLPTSSNRRGTKVISSIDHVAVPMLAVEEMLAFYTGLGCSVKEDYPGYVYSVVFGDNKINFHTPLLWKEGQFSLRGRDALPGCGDLCFVWSGSEAVLLQLLKNLGAAVEDGPVERIGGRDMGRAKGSSIYTRDPDMNLIEFIMYDKATGGS